MSAWRKAPCKALPCITKRSASGFASHNTMYVLWKPRNWQSDYWSQLTILAPLCLILHPPWKGGLDVFNESAADEKLRSDVQALTRQTTGKNFSFHLPFLLDSVTACIIPAGQAISLSWKKNFYLPSVLHQIRSDLAYLQTWPTFCEGEVQSSKHFCPSLPSACW